MALLFLLLLQKLFYEHLLGQALRFDNAAVAHIRHMIRALFRTRNTACANYNQ